MMIRIREADSQQRSDLIDFLTQYQLPANDLPDSLANFWLAFDEEKLVGSVGFEYYGLVGLLRSLCVQTDYRNQTIARQLYEVATLEARKQGIATLYLLTTSADHYFERLGFKTLSRNNVPQSIRQTYQFRDICPSSAVVMYKLI